MSKPAPARYRTTNWSAYNAALRRPGSVLVWLDREMEWLASPSGRPGRPQTFSEAAIQFCLSIKVLFGLALRQAIGTSPSWNSNSPIRKCESVCIKTTLLAASSSGAKLAAGLCCAQAMQSSM